MQTQKLFFFDAKSTWILLELSQPQETINLAMRQFKKRLV
jgi:hypothetical protein